MLWDANMPWECAPTEVQTCAQAGVQTCFANSRGAGGRCPDRVTKLLEASRAGLAPHQRSAHRRRGVPPRGGGGCLSPRSGARPRPPPAPLPIPSAPADADPSANLERGEPDQVLSGMGAAVPGPLPGWAGAGRVPFRGGGGRVLPLSGWAGPDLGPFGLGGAVPVVFGSGRGLSGRALGEWAVPLEVGGSWSGWSLSRWAGL